MKQISRNDSKLSKEINWMIRRKTITVLRVFTCVLSYLTAKILSIVVNGTLLNEYFKSPTVNFRDRYTFVPIDVESLIF